MRFEWDENKNRANRAKHRIGFETAKFVFDDPVGYVEPAGFVDGEERWMIFGTVGDLQILAVCHTHRRSDDEEIIRIISARKAAKHERENYYKQAGF